MSYHVIVVPHPLNPNKRVRVEVPDKLSAKDAKHAIEWPLLAKYGRAAPCQQQHVRHDQRQAVVENDQAPYRETMGWGVQESLQNMTGPTPGCGELDTLPPWQWRRGQWKGPHMRSVELD